jgi:hypothetical protein
MTELRDQDWEPVEGAEDLPADTKNGEIEEPVGPDADATDPGLADPPEDGDA